MDRLHVLFLDEDRLFHVLQGQGVGFVPDLDEQGENDGEGEGQADEDPGTDSHFG